MIRNHLSKIHADESRPNQARLVFEAQADFIVRLKDILIDELIHSKYYETANKVISNPNEDNLSTLKSLLDRGMPESEEAELELLEKHRGKHKYYHVLKPLTRKYRG